MRPFLAILICATLPAAATMPEQARDRFSHTFSGDTALNTSNVNGFTEVIGDGGSTIRIDAERIIRAESREDAERAKREVMLEFNEANGTAEVRVNHNSHEHYRVSFNLTIHVPKATALELRSVNGRIQVTGTSGHFQLRTVNGTVKASDIEGEGKASTVNGSVNVAFTTTPRSETSFETVNGRIDVTLPPDLKADLHLRTLHGSAYTDFDAVAPAGSRFEFGRHSSHSSDLKIGGGGVALNFKTLNGGVTIHKGGSK